MSKDKMNKGAVEAYNKRHWWGTVVKMLVVVLLIIIIGVAGFVTYLQSATFEALQKKSTSTIFANNVKDELVYSEKGFVVSIPDEVIGSQAGSQIEALLNGSGYTLENIYYEGSSNTFFMNLSHSGFYIPLSFETKFSQQETKIVAEVQSIHIGKHHIEPFWPIDQIIDGLLPVTSVDQIAINSMPLELPEGIYFDGGRFEEGIFELYYKVDTQILETNYKAIKQGADSEMIEAFKLSEDLNAAKAGQWMSQVYPLSQDQVTELVNDLRTNQVLIKQLLVLASADSTKTVSELLETYGIVLDQNQIAMERKVLEGKKMDETAMALLYHLDEYFSENFIAFNQGKPFDIANHDTITIGDLAVLNEMEIEAEVLDRLSFIKKDGVGVAYELDEETYYIKYLEHYEVQNAIEFANYEGAGPYREAELVEDLTLWNEVLEVAKVYFNVETVFVRYMKSDGDSVFLIASPEDDPQQYWNIALARSEDGSLEILNDNVQSVMGFYESNPEFNIETLTYEIETAKLLRIDSDIHDTILHDMYQNGIIGRPSNYTIIYSSYDGKYIAFVLDNGKEYVYRVEGTSFGTYLQTVYRKDKAISNWPDMPRMIVLQDTPTE